MDLSDCLSVLNNCLIMMLKVSAPVLLLSMLVGLVIAIFQAATQIHEQTITFVPKLMVIVIVLIAAGNWMMSNIRDITMQIFELMVRG